MSPAPTVEYLLRLADNALVLSHRLAQWSGHGPVLEEDIALTNIALDLLGQARLLYEHAGATEGAGRSEDDFAYFRDVGDFRNFTMLELPNSGVASAGADFPDYGFTIVRNFLYASYSLLQWQALSKSSDPQLAGIAAKAVKETRFHLRHAQDWLLRFGDGTQESHRRAQSALDSLVPYTNEWFVADAVDAAAAGLGIGVDPETLREPWLTSVRAAVEQATLSWPSHGKDFVTTGRKGLHGEHLGYLLAEMQSVARAHPGARW
jgi:ring-1,2-phenylacetyl-CoA epoxidase subunit PaaC